MPVSEYRRRCDLKCLRSIHKCTHDRKEPCHAARARTKGDGGERHVRCQIVSFLLGRHCVLHALQVGQRAVLVYERDHVGEAEAEVASDGHEVVREAAEGLYGRLYGCKEDGNEARVRELLDAARLDDHKQVDEHETAEHFDQLPPEELRFVLFVQEADRDAHFAVRVLVRPRLGEEKRKHHKDAHAVDEDHGPRHRANASMLGRAALDAHVGAQEAAVAFIESIVAREGLERLTANDGIDEEEESEHPRRGEPEGVAEELFAAVGMEDC